MGGKELVMPPPQAAGGRLKRGFWSAEEDVLLKKCVETHGEANWATISTQSGLMRSGKSCRLRWKNYLRPNIKRGMMSPDEKDLIIRMHKLLGNRWSLIAGRLPGRTDNEVKNFWNTHLNNRSCPRRRSMKKTSLQLPQVVDDRPDHDINNIMISSSSPPPAPNNNNNNNNNSITTTTAGLQGCCCREMMNPAANKTELIKPSGPREEEEEKELMVMDLWMQMEHMDNKQCGNTSSYSSMTTTNYYNFLPPPPPLMMFEAAGGDPPLISISWDDDILFDETYSTSLLHSIPGTAAYI
ncbi:unnamed protein product [Cuscuta europaea]|uniref:Uncharacterized protein n=1 Tax=Cuscuta europaea TaxID=41803 RepID=A0A9P0ZGT2_CUSEU|nr:unnamed protein product [Cuscuta europaea]